MPLRQQDYQAILTGRHANGVAMEGETMRGKDAKEAQAAFAEKRAPVFSKR